MENTNNESLKGVKILRSFYEALDEFTYEEKGRMFEAIMEYGLNGVEPNFDDADDARALKAIWKTYLPVVNNSISRAIASAKNGSKGGAPKKSIEATSVASNTQTENKAPETTISTQDIPEAQVEEKVSEIEANEEIDICMDGMISYDDETKEDYILPPTYSNDKIDDLKEILSSDFPMSTDIERSLTRIFKNSLDDFEIKNMVKEIKRSKITSETIEEFISKKMYSLN